MTMLEEFANMGIWESLGQSHEVSLGAMAWNQKSPLPFYEA